jgi:2-polyprenyl-6-methoxyphenol hydroxylase-like FAD-dependent oxidoreductase
MTRTAGPARMTTERGKGEVIPTLCKPENTVAVISTDVLIVGAGAAGLTLAIELARRGIRFRLIEKLEGPFRGSRGKGIQPRSQEIFEDLGILDRLVAAGGVYPPQREYGPDGSYNESLVVEPQDPTPDEPYHIALLVPQFATEAVMRERLMELGTQPEYRTELVGIEQDDEGVTARMVTASGATDVRARYLVGCDGGRSFVRQALGIEFPGKTLGVRAVVADVLCEGIDRDAWHRFNEGSMQSQLSLCPLPGTDLFQLQAPVPLEGDCDLSAAGLTAMIVDRIGQKPIAVKSVAWASAFNMNARLAARYRQGRVYLAGDAAHVHPPTGGQGLNTSIQDAYNLGWKLAAVLTGAPESLLGTYEEERRPIAEQVLGLSTALLDAAKHGAKRRGREVHQLDLGYPGSSLALEAPMRTGGMLAGDRAPDAMLRGAAGQPHRLFSLFKGPHWTLLGYQPPSAMRVPARGGLHIHIVGPNSELDDVSDTFRNAYGVEAGEWVLVRPDGYIGAIVSSGELASLHHYLDRVCVAAG